VQETTATFLTAALASRNSGASTSSSNAASSNEQSSSSTVVPSPSTDKHVQYEEAKPAVTSDVTEEKKGHECKVEVTRIGSHCLIDLLYLLTVAWFACTVSFHLHGQEKDTEMNEKTSSRSYDTSKSKSVVDEQPTSSTKVHKGSVGPADIENSRADHNSSSAEDGCPAPEKISGHHLAAPGRGEQLVGIEVKEAEQDEKAEAVNHMQAYASDGSVRDNMPSDVHLNIRLPAGSSLQEKFSVTSTLRMVKDYVDGNLPSGFGTYDLAIPYPRKIFSSQGMNVSTLLVFFFFY
jgi:hypothetical protein